MTPKNYLIYLIAVVWPFLLLKRTANKLLSELVVYVCGVDSSRVSMTALIWNQIHFAPVWTLPMGIQIWGCKKKLRENPQNLALICINFNFIASVAEYR